MDLLREKVSGKKNRLVQDSYNLDLSYITNRIIAMSVPGQGFNELYRNPIDKVAQYLNTNHQENYFIFNLSQATYDEKKFRGQCFKDYNWKDHHSPTLNVLFDICLQIHNILKANLENVIVVHCKAGKGRTGTLICCYLLYSGKFDNINDTLNYYGKKRFNGEGLSVNQPCQIKYIEYFYKLLNKQNQIFPNVINLKGVTFHGKCPSININGCCYPYIEIIDVQTNRIIYQTEKFAQKYKENFHQIKFQQYITVVGDILIKVFSEATIKNKKMFRFAFNTAFIEQQESSLTWKINDLDPSQIIDDKRFDNNFRVELNIEQCNRCNNKSNFKQKCQSCQPFLVNQLQLWNRINDIIETYQKPDEEKAIQLLFINKKNDDVKAILKGDFIQLENSIHFNWDHYNTKEKE